MASPLQAAIAAWTKNTFGDESANDPEARLRKLSEEVEELIRAWFDKDSQYLHTPEIMGELGDVYLCLLALGASLGLDIEKMGNIKMKELGKRVYELTEKGWVKVGS